MELAHLSTRTLEQTSKLIQENACGVRARLPLRSHFHPKWNAKQPCLQELAASQASTCTHHST